MTARNDLKIVLIGKTGNGKSATGNSILGREKFDVSSNANSRTKLGESGVKQEKNSTLTVFDTRGLFDADTDTNEDSAIFIKHVDELMTECPRIDAFLLILRLGTFAAEDQQTIETLKMIFGSDFIKDYCYLVVTHGDNYEEMITFNKFCENSKGKFKELYNECERRIFLITNKGGYGSESLRVIQGENLVANLKKWLAKKEPYRADTQYKAAAQERKQLAFDADKQNKIKKLQEKIDDLKAEVGICASSRAKPSLDLKGKLHTLRNEIKETDPDTMTKNLKDFLDQTEELIRISDSLPVNSGCALM